VGKKVWDLLLKESAINISRFSKAWSSMNILRPDYLKQTPSLVIGGSPPKAVIGVDPVTIQWSMVIWRIQQTNLSDKLHGKKIERLK